jgi:L-threonylcarbamoyladenylate synthase
VTPPNPTEATSISAFGTSAIAEAAALILAGRPVAVPTETVYGLAADATNAEAVEQIYAAKGRPSFNPLIVHVRDLAQAEEHGLFSDAARAAAQAWWPGPLTIVVPRRPGSGIAECATAGLATIALRCPAHPAMQALLAACGRPLAAPSANASGGLSPTTALHVLKSLGGRIPLIIDAGATSLGLESTIVAFTEDEPRLLRPGPIPFDRIAATFPPPPQEGAGGGTFQIEAPGQLPSHYAPSKPLRLDAETAEPDEYWIGFGAIEGEANLSAERNLEEAASRLFALLHRAELGPKPRIAVAPIPTEGIGEAINDRLRRAAAPRPDQSS